jgi:endoglucanase
MVREDQLLAWRWEPNARPAVADMNDASDGDVLVAWALTEAAEYWGDVSYRIAARRIAVEVGRKLLLLGGKDGPLLLPAVAGFSKEDRSDGPVINLSYWVFPAFERLPKVAPEVDWNGLIQSGLSLLKTARFGPAGLPTDWVSASEGEIKPASGFVRAFSYNAIRIPLYMAFAGVGDRASYAPFLALWAKDRTLAPVDIDTGSAGQPFGEAGYNLIAALTLCATQKTPLPYDFFSPHPSENYYPATLQILAVIAAQMRYGSCSKS